IPDNISCLRHLKELWLNDNNLRTIPDNIGNLSQLEWLDLHGNPLIDLPVSLRRLKNLRHFTCDVIDGIVEEDVRIWSNKTKIRKLFDKMFKRKEYIHGWMNSIHSHTTKEGQDLESIIQNVIVIGTKIDLISKDVMEQRKKELQDFLRTMEAAEHIAWPIIPISNKPMQSPSPGGNLIDSLQSPSPDGNQSDALQTLKDKIKELVCQLSHEVPFNWLLFELLLNQKVVEENLRPVMTLVKVYE
ncbi:uncharacterized protein LOC144350051, partial [Saccoglossus kowalevskii]